MDPGPFCRKSPVADDLVVPAQCIQTGRAEDRLLKPPNKPKHWTGGYALILGTELIGQSGSTSAASTSAPA
ncbi:hypothetical protein LA080_003290 [Diaporthe eres]|nr:hypothetical protein LA080_003290 [Diaporthe eres]